MLGYMLATTISLALIVLMVSWVLAFSKLSDSEKSSPFECGFIPHSPARTFFSFHFFSISLLFLVFDVELVLLFPILLNPSTIPHGLILGLFIAMLAIGTLWEWSQKMLKWSE